MIIKYTKFLRALHLIIGILIGCNSFAQSGWQQQTSGTNQTLLGVIMTDINTAYVCGVNGIILKSTNSGSNWQLLTTGTTRFLRSISYVSSDVVYTAGELGIILKTTNGGGNWQNQPINITSELYSIHFTDSQNGLATGQNGIILKTISGGIGINQISTEIPERFALYQNYPNPFNPSTVITFDLLNLSHIKLTIFDITGKVVERIVNEKLSAGKYDIEWEAGSCPSGVYFCKLETEKFSSAIKMIVLK